MSNHISIYDRDWETLLREIYGDESAGQMATSILANMGVPSFMITPKDEYGLTEEEGESISKAFQRRVGVQNRGKPFVLHSHLHKSL